jgi:PAS domain S-box-containing protein
MWLWLLTLVIVYPVLIFVGYKVMQMGGVYEIERWKWVMILIYATNLVFALIIFRVLNQTRVSDELLVSRTAELEEKRAKDEALIGSIGEGVVVTDQNGLIEIINKPAEDMVGWKQAEVVGKKWFEVVPLLDQKGELVPGEKRATQKVLNTGKPIISDANFYVRRDGSKFQVGTTAAPVILNGKTVGVIAVFRDITHEKEVDKAKTEFVSLASHQLRTPLSAIKWYAEMLLNGDAGALMDQQKDFVKFMYQSNQRMIELVGSLLNISRIESGRIRIDPIPTDLGELVNQLLGEMKPKIVEKNLKLVVSVHPELPKIKVDPKMIRQVYMNLISNSLKYTPADGTIMIFISQKNDEVISQITDNGCGIARRDYQRVFEKFYRGENAQKMETDGTGLGLYLVKAIVESSRGRIWFESEENKGTTFWFSLPMSGMPAKKGEVAIDS